MPYKALSLSVYAFEREYKNNIVKWNYFLSGNLKVWTPVSHLPLCSVRTAIECYLDINTPPTPPFLRMLAAHATIPKDRERLLVLGKVNPHLPNYYTFFSLRRIHKLCRCTAPVLL